MNEQITAWGSDLLGPRDDVIAATRNLMGALHREFTYAPGKTTSRTPPQEAFEARHGVCQDFAHVMIMALRAHGIPAAYISGYLLTRPPPGKPKLVGADAMHAWADVWCGNELGWVGFDPTNNCLVSEDHIAIAMGRDYADISPIDGTFIGSAPQSMVSAVDVVRMD
jgi:transglutaminase-like putative cysteine protease